MSCSAVFRDMERKPGPLKCCPLGLIVGFGVRPAGRVWRALLLWRGFDAVAYRSRLVGISGLRIWTSLRLSSGCRLLLGQGRIGTKYVLWLTIIGVIRLAGRRSGKRRRSALLRIGRGIVCRRGIGRGRVYRWSIGGWRVRLGRVAGAVIPAVVVTVVAVAIAIVPVGIIAIAIVAVTVVYIAVAIVPVAIVAVIVIPAVVIPVIAVAIVAIAVVYIAVAIVPVAIIAVIVIPAVVIAIIAIIIPGSGFGTGVALSAGIPVIGPVDRPNVIDRLIMSRRICRPSIISLIAIAGGGRIDMRTIDRKTSIGGLSAGCPYLVDGYRVHLRTGITTYLA